MSEKFKKIVNAPHRIFGRARKKITDTHPQSKVGRAARVTGITTTGLFQFLLWAVKYAALDNHAIRGMEKGLGRMRAKHPDISAHLLYYMMMAGIVAAGNSAYDKYYGDDENQDKIENVIEDDGVEQQGTYGAYLEKLRPLEPMVIADLIAKEGVQLNAKGECVPYKDSRGYWTIGFGSTFLKDGTKVTKHTKPITLYEAYELSRWHLENETFLLMYWYDVAHDKVNINTTEEAFAIASIMYNAYANLIETPSKKDDKGNYIFRNKNYDERSAALRADFAKYGLALSDSVVLKRFAEYPITHTESFGKLWLAGADKKTIADKFGQFLAGGDGIRWRRWLEAETFMGHITPDMLLNCPMGGMYEFFAYVGRDRANWFLGDEKRRLNTKTIEKFREWIKDPKQASGASLARWKKVKDFLPAQAREMCESGKCTLGSNETVPIFEASVAHDVKRQTYVTEYRQAYNAAAADFKNGNYEAAAAKLEKLIEGYPDNALVHNDLAATYNELGRYDDAIAQVRIIFDKIGDTEQYGAAYFNAGRSREGLGQKQKALANYRLAVKHGNSHAQKDITRLSPKQKNLKQQRNAPVKKKVPAKKTLKNKKRVFNNAIKKLRNHAHSADFDISNAMRSGHDMA